MLTHPRPGSHATHHPGPQNPRRGWFPAELARRPSRRRVSAERDSRGFVPDMLLHARHAMPPLGVPDRVPSSPTPLRAMSPPVPGGVLSSGRDHLPAITLSLLVGPALLEGPRSRVQLPIGAAFVRPRQRSTPKQPTNEAHAVPRFAHTPGHPDPGISSVGQLLWSWSVPHLRLPLGPWWAALSRGAELTASATASTYARPFGLPCRQRPTAWPVPARGLRWTA